MNTRIKKFIAYTAILCLLTLCTSTYTDAKETSTTIEHYSDGSYMITTLTEDVSGGQPFARSTSTKSGQKTFEYFNSSNVKLWDLTVKGTFTYGNGSSSCTESHVSAYSYSSAWKLSSRWSSKSSNTASAGVTAKHYSDSTLVNSINKTISLSCSSSGKLS